MATANKKATESAEYSIGDKIKALYDLQTIDTKIDEINKLKGELPLEVQDLEDEIAGLETRIANINGEIEELEMLTKQRKDEMANSRELITKYDEQMRNVRNNREFDSLNKEIEYQNLEIELGEKRLREYSGQINSKKLLAESAQENIEGRRVDLQTKRAELDSIDRETATEMEALMAQRNAEEVKIDLRLLETYTRIRSNVRNGLGVVTVKRNACGGCFNRIAPQRQFEIRQNRKIIVCEYCGRILVSDLFDESED